MKIRKEIIGGLGAILLISSVLLTGCSDEFLKDKKDYSHTTEDIYNHYEGAKGRIDNIYSIMLPSATGGISWSTPSAGTSDNYSKSTEEYGGLSKYVDAGEVLSSNNIDDYFHNETKTSNNPWGRIRVCNDAIEGITHGTLLQEEKDELLGQAYFFRAWAYYNLVKIYGGVPIIDYVQNVIVGDEGGSNLVIPRSTTKECIDFICNDLSTAAKCLPFEWNAANYGRVSAGTALALEGRARLLYASPLFNRADDKIRWELAYEANKNALDTLIKSGYGLAYLDNPGINASGWAKMFSDYKSSEAVFVTLYNRVKESPSIAPEFNNMWEQSIRPRNTNGGGGRVPTDVIIDLFPMKDGKKPTQLTYDENLFMLNRDPRFYRTFAFPGVRWAFSGDPTSLNIVSYPYRGPDYELWNYAWYDTQDKLEASNKGGYGADGLGLDYKGIYIRKRTDDYDINKDCLYDYDINNQRPFRWSAAPYMEIRYAEVLLNFAESACGAGHLQEAIDALKLIRQRVGYTEENNYGLDLSLNGDRAKLFEAILYERQIELAYEGKRFDDMRRWLLWDGGLGHENIHPTWKLTGFNGNTCQYLNIDPFNGKRRDAIELRVADAINGGIAEAKPEADPIKDTRPNAWDLSKSESPSEELENFYRSKLTRKKRQSDALDKSVLFKPEYYFIGLRESAQKNNIKLEQTIGWDDTMTNGPGTFDPLAE